MIDTALQRFQGLLGSLFQFDDADLDFGIYRIMNQKRGSVEEFLATLPERVKSTLRTLGGEQLAEAERELAQRKQAVLNTLGGAALLDDGAMAPAFEATPIGEEYSKARTRLHSARRGAMDEASVYNALVDFFTRYYDNGDFIAQRRYGTGDAYAVPFNGEETLLYYANSDQYYVKTGERFSTYQFTTTAAGATYTVRFRLENASVAQNNNKSERAYFVLAADDPITFDAEARLLTVNFNYRQLAAGEGDDGANAQKQQEKLYEEVLRRVLDSEIPIELADKLNQIPEGSTVPLLHYHLRRFGRRRSSDFFVHKALERFLNRELDTYIKQHVVDWDALASMSAGDLDREVLRWRAVREIGAALNAFLGQIEDFQRRLFEKPKFVVRADYLITLDLVPSELYGEIAACEPQIAAWRKLYRLPALAGTPDADVLAAHPGLMLDTRLLPRELAERALAAVPDLETATGGVLIESENLQALRLLRERYRGAVKCIYIDPPYNTGNDGFLYKDRYRHSSWLAMMYDRLLLARELLSDDGVIFVSIDDNEQANLKRLADDAFGEDNTVATVIWQKVYAPKNSARYFSEDHDYILVYAKHKEKWLPSSLPRSDEANARYRNLDDDERGVWKPSDLTARNYYSEGQYEVESPGGSRFTPPAGRYWVVSKANFKKLDDDKRIWWGKNGNNMPAQKRFLSEVKQGIVPQTLWLYGDVGHTQDAKKELLSLITFERSEDVLNTVKPTALIRRVLQIGTNEEHDDTIVDFFAGSGTTGHAVIKQNRADGGQRKFILVEMGDYFETMVVPRVIKAAWGDDWKDGAAGAPAGGSHVFRVERLESYEDALNNIGFDSRLHQHVMDLFDEHGREEYILRYQLDAEARGSPTLLNVEALRHPFDYRLAIADGDTSPRPTVVDLPATFAYLSGMRVKQYQTLYDEGRRYVVQRGSLNGNPVVVVWRDLDELDLRRDEAFVKANVPLDGAKLYFNADGFFDGEPVDLVFHAAMR